MLALHQKLVYHPNLILSPRIVSTDASIPSNLKATNFPTQFSISLLDKLPEKKKTPRRKMKIRAISDNTKIYKRIL